MMLSSRLFSAAATRRTATVLLSPPKSHFRSSLHVCKSSIAAASASTCSGNFPANFNISNWRQQQVRVLSTAHQHMSAPSPPSKLTAEMATGTQDAVALLLKHGLGKRRLDDIAKDAGKGTPPLLERWQSMMECFLGTQVHVLAGLGYSPDEQGIALYNQQLALLMQTLDPETQESIRVKGRDTWRMVLSSAFSIPLKEIEENELSIVDARNVMHNVSQKMMENEILELIKKKCSAVEGPEGDSRAMTPAEMQMRHTIVQETLINHVYLGGEPSLVSKCGFGEGERAYVFMQLVMSEHQADPLVSQYVSTAMMEILKSAGLDPASLQKLAEDQQAGKSN